MAVYEEARQIAPENADVRAQLGLALQATGQFAAAREELEEALRLLPEQPEYRDRRNRLQHAMKELARKS